MVTEAPNLTRNWLTPQFFSDPYSFYDELRAVDPVYWSTTLNAWVVTGYEPAETILKAPKAFSSAGRMAAVLDTLPAEQRSQFDVIYSHFSGGLIRSDPPDHTRLRGLISKVFTPRAVENLRKRVEQLVSELLEAIAKKQRVDLIAGFAYPLPAIVICELLGVPIEDRDRVQRWTQDIGAIVGGVLPLHQAAQLMQNALIEVRSYFTSLIETRRHQPQGDLLSLLVTAREQQDRLSVEELLSTAENLLTAGHETTTNLLGSGTWLLLSHPDQLELLQRQPALLGNAIEEMLRCESPIQRQTRVVNHDMEFAGKRMRKDQLVFVMLGAANRDPAVYAEPACFNIQRTDLRHLAFGTGAHFCIGAPLARLEASIAFRTLLQRFLSVRLADPAVRWKPDAAFRALQELMVEM
jgi:cytochrome P450